uniref:Amino acid transporter transmembrane domain-containing protein n=1 Tax=Pyramimonas obovata TaxID=1411642 RepID=A0A7S0MU95_9CHLO
MAPSQPQGTAWGTVATLANICIGVGSLSFPYLYSECGVLGAILLTGFVAMIMSFASNTIASTSHSYKAESYQKLIERAMGPRVGPIVSNSISLAIMFYSFGCCTSFLILLGDALPPIFGPIIGTDSFWCQRWVVITLPAVFVTLPIASVRRLSSLAGISSFSFFALGYTAIAVLRSSLLRLDEHPELLEKVNWGIRPDFFALVSCIPILVYSLQCQVIIVDTYRDLEPHPSLCKKRQNPTEAEEAEEEAEAADCEAGEDSLEQPLIPKGDDDGLPPPPDDERLNGMTAIIVTANILCCIGYTIIGLLGYTAYGNEVEADILNNLPTDWLIQSARVVMALSCACCGFPVNFFPIRSAGLILLRKVAPEWDKKHELFDHYFATLIFWATALTLALNVTDLGKVFSVVGGTAGAFVVFILPMVVWICHWRRERRICAADLPPLLHPSAEPLLADAPAAPAPARPLAALKWGAGALIAMLTLVTGVVLLFNTINKEIFPIWGDPAANISGEPDDPTNVLIGFSCSIKWGC